MKTLFKMLPVALLLTGVLAVSSCKKDKNPEPVQTGSMKVQFDYVFGSNMLPWQIGKTMVHSKTGDTLTFTTFKYYVSNIKLKKADGTWWAQPESYFLVDASVSGGSVINVDNIPAGSYTAMEYTMGVDSARNVSGANTGALSLTNGMFWDWNSGYIMLKAEGNSPQAVNGGFAFHLGGFSGDYNVVTVKTAEFGSSTLTVDANTVHTVKLIANPARLWHTAPSVSVNPTIHAPGPEAKTMAKDFYDNITFSAIE